MESLAKYFHKHAVSDIFPAFCWHSTVSVARLLIFSNNNDGKKKILPKFCIKRYKCFLKLVQIT